MWSPEENASQCINGFLLSHIADATVPFVSNVHQYNKVLTGAWSSLWRVEKNITTNKLVNSYWWRYLQGELRGILPDCNYCISLIHNMKYWERRSSLGLFLKTRLVVTGSLGDAQNYYSYEHPKGSKRKSLCSLRAGAAVYPAAGGGGLRGPPREQERIPLTKLWQSPQPFLGYRYIQLHWKQYKPTAVVGIQHICPVSPTCVCKTQLWAEEGARGGELG